MKALSVSHCGKQVSRNPNDSVTETLLLVILLNLEVALLRLFLAEHVQHGL
jgi:hypothetical protein